MFKWNRTIAAIVSTAMVFTMMPAGAWATENAAAEAAVVQEVEVAEQDENALQDQQEAEAAITAEVAEADEEAAADEAVAADAEIAEEEAADAEDANEADATEADADEADAVEAEEAPEAVDEEMTADASAETQKDAEADSVAEEIVETIPATYDEYSIEGDSDALFEAYANKLFFGNRTAMLRAKKATGDRLEGQSKTIYDNVKAAALEIAAGQRASTVVQIPLKDLGVEPDKNYSAEDLGVDYIYDPETKTFNDRVAFAVMKLFDYDSKLINRTLFADCPYELYWAQRIRYPSRVGITMKMATDETGNMVTYVVFTNPYIEVSVEVESKYRDTSDSNGYTADVEKTGAAANAASYAQTIVSDAAGKSDYEKLEFYRDQICELVTYNEYARDHQDMDDRGPWALIYVFDRKDDTNVVCEGYSEAFQYLCDLTDFDNDEICAYSVTGNMYGGTGGGGAHKWNIVHMEDGYNYIADITNSDEGSWGDDGSLFLKGMEGSVDGGYSKTVEEWSEEITEDDGSILIITHPERSITFTYDEETRSIFTDQELTLSAKDYGQNITTDQAAELMGISLFLTDKIGMKIHVLIDTNEVADDDYMLFEYEGKEVKQLVKDAAPSLDDKVYEHQKAVIFELPLTTTQMTVPVTFKMVVGGRPGTEKEYSVQSYAAEILGEGSQYTDREKRMAEALLHYGAFAQLYDGTNTSDLPDEGYKFDWQDSDLDNMAKYQYALASNSGDSIKLYSATLILGTDISVRYYFDLEDGADLNNYDISVTDDNGKAVGFTTDYNSDKGRYYVMIKDIKPLDIGKMMNLTVKEGGTKVIDLKYAPLSYCYSKLIRSTASGKIQDLCKAMYKYYCAAYNYAYAKEP